MGTKFHNWWNTHGYELAKQKGILNDPRAIAELAYDEGLYTSPPVYESIVKRHGFPTYLTKCDCGGHQLECEIFDWKDGEAGVNFSIWERGRDGKQIRGWKEKFRWCWRILKTGMPWADDIIVTNNEARGLAKFILQHLPMEESNEETKK